MKGAKLISGKNGISRQISKVNTLEMPDIIDWIRGGEFLITTAFAFKENITKLVEQIPLLKQKGAVGIAIKPKRFVEITPELMSICDKYDFPLIELDSSAIFADIVKESIEQIVQNDFKMVTMIQDLTNQIINFISNDTPIEEIVYYLEERFSKKIILINDTSIISYENIVSSQTKFFKINSTQLFSSGNKQLEINDVAVNSYVISYPNTPKISIVILDNDSQLTSNEITVLNKVCPLLFIAVNNINSRIKIRKEYQNKFLISWISGELNTINDIQLTAKSYGIKINDDDKYVVVIVDLKNSEKSLSVTMTQLNSMTEKLASLNVPGFAVFYKYLCLILSSKYTNTTSKNPYLNNIKNYISTYLNEEVQFFVSDYYSINDISKACKEAETIRNISQKCTLNDSILTYKDLGIFSLLCQLNKSSVTEAYINKYLTPLINYDLKHHTKLVDTLKSYYKFNCNAKLTAKESYTHYHTILYRLDRIKEILGLNIDDPEIKLQLQIAIKLINVL